MADEIRSYHVDDPNDAPERRSSAFPTINHFMPQISSSLPPYVIPPVAHSLYTAMQYCWYSAFHQGAILGQKHQQHQILQQQRQAEAEAQAHQQLNHNHTYNLNHLHHNHLHHNNNHNHHNAHHLHHNHNHLNQTPSSPSTLTAHSSASSSSSSSTSSSLAPSSLASSSSSSSPASSSAGSLAAPLVTSTTPASNHQHIKKPLNPFMIYMQKMRPEIVKKGTVKESAQINQMLGVQWRQLSKEEQEPYYKLAEQEKILHAQKYPGWSARDNYANQKKKKKMKLKSISANGLDQSDKKCRARFGLHNMTSWCKPCRRKKKCILIHKIL